MLYKQAEGNKRALTQAVGAVGGGAAGYLLTRYGLGLKGAGAGLAGAGIGATLGAVGGGHMADYGKVDQEAQKKEDDIADENAKLGQDTTADTFEKTLRQGFVPTVGAITGARAGWKWNTDKAMKRLKDRAILDFDKIPFGSAAKKADAGEIAAQAKKFSTEYRGVLPPDIVNTLKERVKNYQGGAAVKVLTAAGVNNHKVLKLKALRAGGGALAGAIAAAYLIAKGINTYVTPRRAAFAAERGK